MIGFHHRVVVVVVVAAAYDQQGGLPTKVDGIITNTYPMERKDDGTFVSIVGLTDKE